MCAYADILKRNRSKKHEYTKKTRKNEQNDCKRTKPLIKKVKVRQYKN